MDFYMTTTFRVNKIYRYTLFSFVVLLGLEIGLRYYAYDDFPIFYVDRDIGYIPKANQAGAYNGKYMWYFNSHHMRNQPFVSDPEHGVLLLGDSIVYGAGINFLPEERLGDQLQQAGGGKYQVWSMGAGSWGFLNELTYLNNHPDVVSGVKYIVWVVNSGDWSEKSVWKTDLIHPRTRPVLLCWYLGLKYIQRFVPNWPEPKSYQTALRSLPVEQHLRLISPSIRSKIVFVAYPDKTELTKKIDNNETLQVWSKLKSSRYPMLDVANHPAWKETLYYDGIHPSAKGNEVLGHIINDFLNYQL